MLTTRNSHMEMNSNIEKLKHSEEDHKGETNAEGDILDNTLHQFCKELETNLLDEK